MIFCFGILLLLVFAGIGRDGRGLPLYGLVATLAAGTVSSGLFWCLASLVLIVFNLCAWFWLRRFAPYRPGRDALWPVLGAMMLLLALDLNGASIGLAPTLATGVTLAGMCGAVSGPPLVQFAALVRTVSGLLVLACVLKSWVFLVVAATLALVVFAFGLVLLPRLAWRRVEYRP